ncbi:hypothetical protein KOR42_33750 [Thalassoglobus neptunius]|uniref:Thioredoxin domain-containing protein n=1 Tax=Thalassoglobus neptunius TaxID=1938619 RepID=A0A5C5WNL6_9PLAN|nr:hypothetical protein [Thalassoglobus neptunius]TWT51689.1 hypothetical protein KOR42_33750 [Thalassoglobus neptunius]
MTRIVKGLNVFIAIVTICSSTVSAESRASQAVKEAAQNDQFAFVMFYRAEDALTQQMRQVLESSLSTRDDAVIVPVQIGDATEHELIKRFDATRIPLPATAVLAPNGAVCTVYPQRVSSAQLIAAIVSPAQAKCLKALQEQKIVVLCAQPTSDAEVPSGVTEFKEDLFFSERTEVVSVLATDPAETKFLNQLRVPTDRTNSIVAFMAPPGVMIGVYDGSITHAQLAQQLAAAGKCCDDENCKHHQSAGAQQPPRR